MTLRFTVSERESLALAERYYKDSPSHQRIRNRTRWFFPIVLLPAICVFIFRFGPAPLPIAVFAIGIVGWFEIYPKLFDAHVRRHAKQQMRESSYAKAFGDYVIHIDEESLMSEGPTGQTTFKWSAIDRVTLTDEFLFVFCSGLIGLPISTRQVGIEQARLAYDRLRQLISTVH